MEEVSCGTERTPLIEMTELRCLERSMMDLVNVSTGHCFSTPHPELDKEWEPLRLKPPGRRRMKEGNQTKTAVESGGCRTCVNGAWRELPRSGQDRTKDKNGMDTYEIARIRVETTVPRKDKLQWLAVIIGGQRQLRTLKELQGFADILRSRKRQRQTRKCKNTNEAMTLRNRTASN